MATRLFNPDGTEIPNGNGGMPWQVRAIGFFGVPSAIAIFLVWNMTGTQANDIREARAQLANHAQVSAVANIETAKRLEHVERVLTAICVNAAKTISERAGCFQ